MSAPAIVYTDAFADAYREIASNSARDKIRNAVDALMTFPDMDAARPRRSLTERYGAGIRTLPAGTCVIVYDHREGSLVLIALVPGKLVI